MNLKFVRRLSVVAVGVALFGCQSRMAYFDGDEPKAGTAPASETPFYFGEFNCPSDVVSADQLERMLIDDATITKFVSRTGVAQDAIPLTVTVARKETAANGAIASVNNFFSFFTLTIWPWVSSSEYQYDVTLSSAIGKHSCQFIVGERDWSGLTPIAMIPVPGWADERGDKSEIMDCHAKSIVTALVNVMAHLSSDYEVFKKNPERYRKAIAVDKSTQALRLFMKAKDERTRCELLAKVVDEEVVGKAQKVFFEAYRSSSGEQLKKNLAEKLTSEWADRLPYDSLSVLRWRKTTNQVVLANVYRRNASTLSPDDAAALAMKITDEGTLKRMVVKGGDLYVEDSHAREALYAQIKSSKIFEAIAVAEAFFGVDRKDLSKLELPYDEVVYDVKLDKARTALSHINNQDALKALALTDKHFSIRAAAIERLEDDAVLDKIVAEKIEKCPYDTSLCSYRPYEDRSEWIEENRQISEIRLTKFAIARMKNVARLRELRKMMGAPALRKAITARLAALGQSDVEELCAYEVYDANLFSMLNGMTNEVELLKVAREAKLKGVRVSAALRCKATEAATVCKKEADVVASTVKDGQLRVGYLHLGMDIQDALAVFAARYQSVGPQLCMNEYAQLFIVDEKKREIVRAIPEELTVNWITLPPSVVQEIVGVKSGTFADLEKAVLKGFGVKFLSGTIRKGDVSQKVATVDTIGGETLRYFRDEVAIGDNIGRKARRHAMDMAVMMPGAGAAESIIAGALAEATDNEINKENAQSDCFAKQGSLQLLRTDDAEKCTQGGLLSGADGLLSQASGALSTVLGADANVLAQSTELLAQSTQLLKSSVSTATEMLGGSGEFKIDPANVKETIRTWQSTRWKSDVIERARKEHGKVTIADLTEKCQVAEVQPIVDLIVSDYVISANLLDAYESANDEIEAMSKLVSSISMSDVTKMLSDSVKVLTRFDEIKKAALRNPIGIAKDGLLVGKMASSMGGGVKVLKHLLEKNIK